MNYLFHLVLSGDNPDIIIGNYIADHIRGTKIVNELPNPVLKGVLLHRAIDAYSDMHPAVRHSVALLKPSHARYASVAVDILYDHFLIKNWKQFVKTPMIKKINSFYALLSDRIDTLPPKSQKVTRKLLQDNWFGLYETFDGLNDVFIGVTKRTHFENALPETVEYLVKYYDELDTDFKVFAHDIFSFVSLHTRYRL
ncbi:MAG TPA: ACP phosphodiesterase [Bacteroidales bacterium]|nr:ACP phosphodiesterase [Bacteroidales bacterium]